LGGSGDGTASFEHIFVGERLVSAAGGEVRDAGKSGDAHAALAGDDCFGDGAHADGIGAEAGEGADFGGGFVGWAGDGEINASRKTDASFVGGLLPESDEGGVVNRRHVGESGIGPAQRIRAHGVYVICNTHEMSGAKARAYAAGGVGENDVFDAERSQDAGWKGDLGHVEALVVMTAAVEGEKGQFA
jgi:hypothetical protein